VQDQHFNPRALNFYAYVWSNPSGLIDRTGLLPSPAQLILGNSVHRAVQVWFEATFPGSETELRLAGFGIRLDMMKLGPTGIWEVYELKSAATLANPRGRREATRQLNNYVAGVRATRGNAQKGGTWNPQGQRVPWNAMFDAILTSDPSEPGLVGYSLDARSDAVDVLVMGFGVDKAIAAAVLAILLELARAGSPSPLFQPANP
jgi:hypothetical protein